ncbi:MAG: outer membrane protein assembly factor [Salinivirgaceae bacterium]|nr:outer membrane protein assembly factor [Salinivirgaceae bacterium]
MKLNKILSAVCLIATITSCNVTRMVPDDEYLLKSNQLTVDQGNYNKQELTAYYRQKANKRAFGILKVKLATYNFAHRGRERKWKNWLERTIGEEPVIYDSMLVVKTAKQFDLLLKNQAYYNAKINYAVIKNDKKAKVLYDIKLGEKVIVDSVNFTIIDTVLTSIILNDSANTKLKYGVDFSLENLQAERDRIAQLVRNNGFYQFNADVIHFSVDTMNNRADIQVIVDKSVRLTEDGSVVKINSRKFSINNVFFYPEYDPQAALRNKTQYHSLFDTTYYEPYYFLNQGKQHISARTLTKVNLIEPQQQYNASLVTQTSKYINSLRIFRLNNIVFNSIAENDTILDCHIQLTPLTFQSYSLNLEGTNTEGNFGVGGSASYQHRNLFHGAELFSLKFSGSWQRQPKTETSDAYNILEFGVESSLETPSFILPFRTEKLYRKLDPRTSLTVAYNFQRRPDYTRSITSLLTTYSWRTSDNLRFFASPIDLNVVKIPFRTEAFNKRIQGKFIENSYKDYFIIGGRYSILHQKHNEITNQVKSYLRLNIDLVGNALHTLHQQTQNADTTNDGHYKIFGLQYAQFFKTDIDIRHYWQVDGNNQVVMRLYGGVAIPYGNATAVPFVRQFYAGGAESMRAWTVRSLGPGTYAESSDSTKSYPSQTADIKLEANIEYRFNITESLKSALFIDAGNIWTYKEDSDRPGAEFKADTFYKQLAIGTGIGVRLDLNFAVIRLDGGIKVKDPTIVGNDSWVLFNEPFKFRSITWQFGIGYPF